MSIESNNAIAVNIWNSEATSVALSGTMPKSTSWEPIQRRVSHANIAPLRSPGVWSWIEFIGNQTSFKHLVACLPASSHRTGNFPSMQVSSRICIACKYDDKMTIQNGCKWAPLRMITISCKKRREQSCGAHILDVKVKKRIKPYFT